MQEVLSTQDFSEVSQQLKNVKEVRRLGSSLGVEDEKIERALKDTDIATAGHRVLIEWIRTQPDDKRGNLIRALQGSGLGRIARSVFPASGE